MKVVNCLIELIIHNDELIPCRFLDFPAGGQESLANLFLGVGSSLPESLLKYCHGRRKNKDSVCFRVRASNLKRPLHVDVQKNIHPAAKPIFNLLAVGSVKPVMNPGPFKKSPGFDPAVEFILT
jgi:hypothetical protein